MRNGPQTTPGNVHSLSQTQGPIITKNTNWTSGEPNPCLWNKTGARCCHTCLIEHRHSLEIDPTTRYNHTFKGRNFSVLVVIEPDIFSDTGTTTEEYCEDTPPPRLLH